MHVARFHVIALIVHVVVGLTLLCHSSCRCYSFRSSVSVAIFLYLEVYFLHFQDEHVTYETVISFCCKSSLLVADFRISLSLRKLCCVSALNVSWVCLLQLTSTLNFLETIHRIQRFSFHSVRETFLSRTTFECVHSSLRLFCNQLVLVLVVEYLTNKIGKAIRFFRS